MAPDFYLIVGLGNPGKKYEGTRHNMGFMVADVLAQRWNVSLSDHKGLAQLGKGVMMLGGRSFKFFLAKPLTFMNNSGNAVASIKSIDRSLGTPQYGRVRMGVGHAARGAHARENTVNWVLGGFNAAQKKELDEFLMDGADAVESLITDGVQRTQEKFNGR